MHYVSYVNPGYITPGYVNPGGWLKLRSIHFT